MFRFLYFRAKKKIPPHISADNQEIKDLKSKAIIENGIMKFRDNEHFNEFLHLKKDDLKSLEKTFGYTSYDSRIDEVIDELALVTTKFEFNLFKKKYQNYMTTRIWGGEDSYERIIEPNYYTLIANKDGLYIIGNTIYRIIGEYMMFSSVKNVDELLKVQYSELQKNSDKSIFNAHKYISSNNISTTVFYENSNTLKSTKSYLGGHFDTGWVTNPDNDRRVYMSIDANTSLLYNPSGHRYYVKLYARGQKRSWITGNWRDYNTDIDIYGTAPGYDVIVWTEYWGTRNYEIFNIHISNSKYLQTYLFDSNYYTSGLGAPIYFTKVKLKAKTRGTGETYAYIDAQE